MDHQLALSLWPTPLPLLRRPCDAKVANALMARPLSSSAFESSRCGIEELCSALHALTRLRNCKGFLEVLQVH